MYRHPFDAISFFFGLLFIAGALSAVFVDDPWPFGRGGVWAIMFIVGGLALLIAAVRPGTDRRPVMVADPMAPAGVATDPLLSQARREVDDYVDPTVPSDAAADDVLTAQAAADDAGPLAVESDGAETVQDEAVDGGQQVGGEPETPDEANHAGP